MNIGLITNMMDSNTGGIGRYTSELVSNILHEDKTNKYFLIHSNTCTYNFKGNYTEIYLPFFSTIPRKLLIGALFFERICAKYNLDILHDLGQISPFYFPSNTKRILTVFDMTPLLFPNNISYLSKVYSKLYPRILKNTDKIITISKHSKQDITKILNIDPKHISVTLLGSTPSIKKNTDTTSLLRVAKKYSLPAKFMLFVGTIEPRKNLPSLIRAFAQSLPSIPKDLTLVIAGGMGWEDKSIYHLPKSLGIEGKIIFIGEIANEDLASIYSLASIFVYPSIYEGFGLPPIEAMACGCPVITSNTGSLPEIVGNAAVTLDPYKLDKSLATNINKILMDRSFTRTLIANGLKRAKIYSWKTTAKQTIALYENI